MASQNISTFRATPEEKRKLDACLATLAIGTRSHFFRVMTLQFIAQVEEAETPEWPPYYQVRTPARDIKRQKKRG